MDSMYTCTDCSKTAANYALASYTRRILAHVVDSVIVKLLIAILYIDSSFFAKLWEAVAISYVLLLWLYYAGLESSKWQATLGKMLFGLVVTDMHGNRISFLRASVRHFSKFISTFLFYMGYICAYFTQYRQTLHDLIAKTLILEQKRFDQNCPFCGTKA